MAVALVCLSAAAVAAFCERATAFQTDGEFAAFTPDGRLVVASRGDTGSLGVWEAASGRLLRVIRGRSILGIAISPGGTRLATTGGEAAIWPLANGLGETHTLVTRAKRGWYPVIWAATFNTAGTRVATAASDGAARIWNASSGKLLHTLRGHNGDVAAVAYSPDGKLLASGGQDGVVRVWDAARAVTLHHFFLPHSSISELAFSADGSRLAVATVGGLIAIWDVRTGRRLHMIVADKRAVWDIDFSPDGRLLLSADEDGTARLWLSASGRLVRTLDGGGRLSRGPLPRVLTATFGPDGQRIATSTGNGIVRIWEASTGRTLRTLRAPGGAASVSFSRDGRYVLASGTHARLWPTRSGRLLHTFR